MKFEYEKIKPSEYDGVILGEGPWIYFLKEEENMWSPVKIGFTSRQSKDGGLPRIKEITKQFRRESLIAALPGSTRLEKFIHKVFDHDRIRGEWFRQTNDLLFLIREMTIESMANCEKNNDKYLSLATFYLSKKDLERDISVDVYDFYEKIYKENNYISNELQETIDYFEYISNFDRIE